MGLLSSMYYGVKMIERYMPSIQNVTEKLVNKYASTIEPEEWTSKVANVEVGELSYQEKQESTVIAMQTAELAAGQCDNLAQAIAEDPVKWGQYLQEKGLDAQKLEEIKQNEGTSIPPLDLIKLTMDGGSSGTQQEAQAEAPQQDAPSETPVNETPEDKTASQLSMLEQAGLFTGETDAPTAGTDLTYC